MLTDRGSAIFLLPLLSVAGIMGRMLPHQPNATPTAALALVAGAALGMRSALLLPMIVLMATDLFLGTYEPLVMVSVYACMAIPAFVGSNLIGERRKPLVIAGSAAICSGIFFIVTNFAVWASGEWYDRTFAGLVACYTAALPFFRNMLAADLLWSGVLFTGLALIESYRIEIAAHHSLRAE
ncbi:hypothetical protein GC170_15150 [bacterium]|nr:hypothetical protein [bacterium]